MKVLHLGKFCPINEGGIEIFSFDLLEYLNKQGVKADMICFGRETGKSLYKGFKYFEGKVNIKFRSAPLSNSYLRTFFEIVNNYDIIHIHSPNPEAEILSILNKKPVVVHWHSDIVKQKMLYRFYKPIQQFVLKKSKYIIATSSDYLTTSTQIKNFKEKAVVIPLGLNHERLLNKVEDEKIKEIKDKREGKKMVLSIGRLVWYKGFEYLIEAARLIRDDAIVVIAGGGELYGFLKNRISKLRLDDKVLLTGRVEEIYSLVEMSDIFCLPSIDRAEAFGLVLVEALYFGKPLITSKVEGSGMNYVNVDGLTGIMVPPKDPVALANAINKLIEDKDLYEKFSENAKNRFNEFEISTVGDKIINLYTQIYT